MKKHVSYLFVSLLSINLLLHCDEKNPVTPQKISISNLSSFKNKILTSYTILGDAVKKDSLNITFDCTGAQSEITIECTIDSGKSWVQITSLPVSNSICTYCWTPAKKNIEQFNFFGGKFAQIRVSAGNTVIKSDTFAILGSVPVQVQSPKENSTFSYNSKVLIAFTFNTGLISHIQTFFRPLNKDIEWIEFTDEDSSINSFSDNIIQRFLWFVPADYPEIDFSQQIELYLKDYSSTSVPPIIIKPITITNPAATKTTSLSNLCSFKNKILTSYAFPGDLVKNDSLNVTFKYTGAQSDINIECTIDSGKSWIQITLLPSSDSVYSYYWTPAKKNIEQLNFCGGKFAQIRVSTESSEIMSDTFSIVGSVPLQVESPKENSSFPYKGNVLTVFTCNTDLTSQIQTFFRPLDKDADFIEFTDQDLPIKSFSNSIVKRFVSFVPADYPEIDFSQHIELYLKEYSSTSVTPISIKPIVIEKEILNIIKNTVGIRGDS